MERIQISNFLTLLDISVQNLTDISRFLMSPYFQTIGSWTWGIIFGFIFALVYDRTKQVEAVAISLIIVGAVGSYLFPWQVGTLFGLIGVFTLAVILIKGFGSKD